MPRVAEAESMPKRTNDFQRLVYLVSVNLEGNAKVTQSKLMRDRLTRKHREVDVVVQGKVGAHPVTVSIECRDTKRVADVTWVDTMKAKHERLETNALLLASRAGFTPEAREVAGKFGIRLFSLEDIDTANMPALLGPNGSLWLKTVSVAAQRVSARVAATESLDLETVATNPDTLVYVESGEELCKVQELVDVLLKVPSARDYLLAEAREDHKWFTLEWVPPVDQEGKPLFMKKLVPEVFRRIESIRVIGPCAVQIGKFGMRHGKLDGITVAWGKAQLSGGDAIAVATVDEAGQHRLSVNFSGAPK